MSRIAGIVGPIPGLPNTFPQNIGGRSFANGAALLNTLGKTHGYLAPGKSIKVTLGQFGPGGNITKFGGLNKNSAFTAKVTAGVLTLTAKKDAKAGSIDRVFIQPGTIPGQKSVKQNFTLEVGNAPIRLG